MLFYSNVTEDNIFTENNLVFINLLALLAFRKLSLLRNAPAGKTKGHNASQFFLLLLTYLYLFCKMVQPGLSKVLFGINVAEGRATFVTDLNNNIAILTFSFPSSSVVSENQ